MKITIETDNDEEKKQLSNPIIFEKVIEFGIVGEYIKGGLYPSPFSHVHINPKDTIPLREKLFGLIERLRNASTLRR